MCLVIRTIIIIINRFSAQLTLCHALTGECRYKLVVCNVFIFSGLSSDSMNERIWHLLHVSRQLMPSVPVLPTTVWGACMVLWTALSNYPITTTTCCVSVILVAFVPAVQNPCALFTSLYQGNEYLKSVSPAQMGTRARQEDNPLKDRDGMDSKSMAWFDTKKVPMTWHLYQLPDA